jgi:ribosomal-protein-alanine N-acetyltransferase
MQFLPIDINQIKNIQFADNPECTPVMEAMYAYYQKIGFNKPWIGYFASVDGKTLVGVAGYKGMPKNGKIEIAYGTFKQYEGQGIGTNICRQLVYLAQQTDPAVRITARTLQDGHASMAILKKNGFQCMGIVSDEDDGDVFEWEFPKNSH